METLKQLYDTLGVHEAKLQFHQNQTGASANHSMPVSTFTG
jgi:hypothetical protein